MCQAPRPLASFDLPDEAATEALGHRLAEALGPGDTLLLSGPIGAGKSALARSIVRRMLGDEDAEVPSPTYTLVQTYEAAACDIWHADLYRLGSAQEVVELGLDAAFDTAICLVEWPDRLGALRPARALSIELAAGERAHRARITATGDWPRFDP